MENGLKTSQLPAALRLAAGDLIPAARGGGNVRLPADALQARWWWPEISRYLSSEVTHASHFALQQVPTAHLAPAFAVPLVALTPAILRQLPLIAFCRYDPLASPHTVGELEMWRLMLSVGPAPATDPGAGIVRPADYGADGALFYWARLL